MDRLSIPTELPRRCRVGQSLSLPSLSSCHLSLSIAQAPDMFDKTHIWSALKQVESILLGKYGMKTLDPRSVSCLSLSDRLEQLFAAITTTWLTMSTTTIRTTFNVPVVSTITMDPNGCG